jgi:hypothetical protein
MTPDKLIPSYAQQHHHMFPLRLVVGSCIAWLLVLAGWGGYCWRRSDDPHFGVPIGPWGAFELWRLLASAVYLPAITLVVITVWIINWRRMASAAKAQQRDE